MADEIVNRVASSPLVSVDLGDYRDPGERVLLDIKDQLHMGMILREKDFREYIASNDWSVYQGKHVAVTCSADAIVPELGMDDDGHDARTSRIDPCFWRSG